MRLRTRLNHQIPCQLREAMKTSRGWDLTIPAGFARDLLAVIRLLQATYFRSIQ
ncbi:hypothetical protein BDR04DRAFT_1104931 [Suillus decipiens]|nr:hypothetical protein BDR04DRAFT_1104931 [Suillus decipiens]